MSPARQIGIAIAVLLCIACNTAPKQTQASRDRDALAMSPDVYRLISGDVVRVDIYQEPDLSGKFKIEPDGTINYPLLGRIPAEGESLDMLQRRLRKRLSEGFLVDPDVRVAIESYKPIYVIGAVRGPGEYGFKPGLTAQQAITRAGGPTKFASEKIYVQRNGTRPEQSYRISADTHLFPGDLISVEERLF